MNRIPWNRSSSKTNGFLCVSLLVACVWSLMGCSTDIDLTAPYDRTPVVFGLLEAKQDTQWVRINRTWLGEGNQFDSALQADSSEYDATDLVVEIEERKGSEAVRSWSLQDTLLDNKSPEGIFFGPDHQMWFFVPENGLDVEAEYDFSLDIADGKHAEASTNMIVTPPGNITQPPPGVVNYKFNFASIGFQTTYPDIKFKWSSTDGASQYDISMRIHVEERIWADLAHTQLVDERSRVIEWPMGSLRTSSDGGGEALQKEVNGERFFSTLATKLEEDPYITRILGVWDEEVQIARAFDFILTIANDELATYLEVNNPVTGIIQERPGYTNIQNGLGLFASRATQGVYGVGYTTSTIEHLIEGDGTAALNFCSPNPFSDFSCE